jgi:hypothetical protein
MLLFLIALAAAAVVGSLLWKVMTGPPAQGTGQDAAPPRRSTAPDDDPEFLRLLGERLRREGEDPRGRR